MKKNFFVFCFVLMQSVCAFAQNVSDESAVLQLCIDLPEMQEFYEGDQLYVMKNSVPFEDGLSVVHDGKDVIFYDKEGLKTNGITNYFLLSQFYVGNINAEVKGAYILDFENNHLVEFNLSFEKVDGAWSVVKSSVKNK